MNQPWKVILAFTGVFLAGVVCGGPLLDWLRERSESKRPPFAERTMRRFEKELNLTEVQKEKIGPILLRTQTQWRQFRQENVRNLMGVIDRMHSDIAAELTPEQRTKLEAISNEFRTRAERFRGRIRDQDPPPTDPR